QHTEETESSYWRVKEETAQGHDENPWIAPEQQQRYRMSCARRGYRKSPDFPVTNDRFLCDPATERRERRRRSEQMCGALVKSLHADPPINAVRCRTGAMGAGCDQGSVGGDGGFCRAAAWAI